MLVFGLLATAGSATTGVLLGWQNRNTPVRARVGGLEWTGQLSTVLIVGAVLACWFLLGIAFVACRIAELRQQRHDPGRRTRSASASYPRTARASRQRSPA